MKKLFLLFMLISFEMVFSQVGINTTSPNAQLDIKSSNQVTPANTDGILIPKIDAFPVTNPTAAQNSMLVYLTTTASGKPPGFYYWDEATTSWKGFKADGDADFFEVGSTNPPDDSNDAMFHLGNVAIGKNTTTARLDVEQTATTPYTLRLKHSNVANNSLGSLIDGDIQSNQTNGFITGLTQRIEPNNNVQAVATNITFQGATSNMIYGSKTDFANTGTGLKYGIHNTFSSGTGSSYGLFNSFSQASTVSLRGVYNGFGNTTGSGNMVGLENYFNGNGNGAVLIGVSSSFSSNTTSNIVGYNNYITSDASGGGNKYGLLSNIDSAAGGVHYGVYSQAQKSNSYAGYFLGRMAIGSSISDTYILPLARGTVSQIMQTDASGNVTWQNPNTALNSFAWSTTGNSVTNPATNFIGTTDNVPLNFRVYGVRTGRLEPGVSGNVFFGAEAGLNNIGTASIGIGYRALSINESTDNIGLGSNALKANLYGSGNIAIGKSAQMSNSYGSNNIGLGTDALYSNMHSSNIAIGTNALHDNGIGFNSIAYNSYNVAIGDDALKSNQNASAYTGVQNTAIGHQSSKNNINGADNTAIGFRSMYSNVGGSKGVAIGTNAMYYAYNGLNPFDNTNVAVGYEALKGSTTPANNTGNNNTVVGYQAMILNSGGEKNTAIGTLSLSKNTTGEGNTAVGYQSLLSNTFGFHNTASGVNALYSNISANFNTAHGHAALYSNSYGSNNTANGYKALYSNTTGRSNTGDGDGSLYFNTIGEYNTAIGSEALFSNATGNHATAIGARAMYYANNVVSGTPFTNTNVAVGYEALRGSTTAANNTGSSNTAVGYQSLRLITSGNRNVGLGWNTLSGITTGNYNTAVGSNTYVGVNFSNSSAIGDAATVTAGNQVRLGDGGVSSIGGFANWTNVSDARFKKDIQHNVPGLELIKRLKPVTYHLDMDAIASLMKTPGENRKKESEAEKGKILQTGFIAQEVEQAANELHYDFSGVDKPKNESDFYGLRYAEFVVPLVKAVQEQQEIIEGQNKKIELLQKANTEILRRLELLENK